MSLCASATPLPLYSPAADRSLGPGGAELRRSLTSALTVDDSRARLAEIYRRISAALQKAGTEDTGLTSPEAVGRAIDLLCLLPPRMPLPDVVVESENEIGLDWDEGSRRVVSLTVRDTPAIGFAAILGAEPLDGRMPFVGEVPERRVTYLVMIVA